jgi:hypothetical protein
MKKPKPVFSDARIGAYVDLTPAHFACSVGMSCPAVYKGDENYVVVGRLVTPEEPTMRRRVGPGEAAVEISAELLEGAIKAAIGWLSSEAAHFTPAACERADAKLLDMDGPPSNSHTLPR